ncbi:MAG: hypothetical protein L3J41_06170 [Melioribacteraceae bacterium]|nr:hypothetical protein [Melioribacteraceae bacterium]
MVTNENHEKVSGKLLKEIGPKALNCSKRTKFVWGLDHYKPRNGKEIGFWPTGFASMSKMKVKWGFSNVFIRSESEYTQAKNAGFTDADMMANVTITNNTTSAYSYPFKPAQYFENYYIDEPSEHGKTLANVDIVAKDLAPNLLKLGSYKIGFWLDPQDWHEDFYKTIISWNSNVRIMSDNYYGLLCAFDQRSYWDDFKDAYGNKNEMNWTSLIIDRPNYEFFGLFQKASSLGMNSLWLYIGREDTYCGDGTHLKQSLFDSYLSVFLSSAKSAGWLTQYDRLYRFEYSCPTADPCNTCDQNNISESSGWVLDKVINTGYIEEWDESHWEETTQ